MRLWVPHQVSHHVQHRCSSELKGMEWVLGGRAGVVSIRYSPEERYSKNS